MSENRIGCEVCRDLLPLVRDGVASAESEAAVRGHAAGCPACAALLAGAADSGAPNDAAVLRRVRRRFGGAALCLVLLGSLAGVGLTGGAGVFYNAAIMPLLGAAMYGFLKEKGLLAAPLVVLLTLGWGALRLVVGPERESLGGFAFYGVIYALLVALGWLAALLLGYALHKGPGRPALARAAAGAAAALLAAFLISGYVQLNGELFTRIWLTLRTRSYVSERWPGADYQVEFAGYSFKTGEYLCHVTSPSSPDTRFSVYVQEGALADSYEEYVASGRNTAERLQQELGDWAERTLQTHSGLAVEFAFVSWEKEETPPVELDQLLRLDRLPAPFALTAWVTSDQAGSWAELARILLELQQTLEAEGVRATSYSVDLRWPAGPDGQPVRYDGAAVYDLPAEVLENTPAARLPAALEAWQAQREAQAEK